MCAHVRLLWMMSPKNFVSFPFNNVFHNKTQLFWTKAIEKKSKIKTIWRARAIDSKRHIRRPREVKTMEKDHCTERTIIWKHQKFYLHLTSKNKSKMKMDERINIFSTVNPFLTLLKESFYKILSKLHQLLHR